MRVPVKMLLGCIKHICKSSVLRQGCSEKTYHIIIQIPSEANEEKIHFVPIVGLTIKFYKLFCQ